MAQGKGIDKTWLFIGFFVFAAMSAGGLSAGNGDSSPSTPQQQQQKQSYSSCNEVRQAGVTLRRGDPGYVPYFDKDLDGLACEPGE